MGKFKTKVKVGDKEEEVEVESPEGWKTPEEITAEYQLKSDFAGELDRRVTAVTKDLAKPDDLLTDDEFLKRVASSAGMKMKELLGVPKDGKEVDVQAIKNEAQEAIRREELKPLEDSNKELVAEVDLLRVRDLEAQALEVTTRLHIKDDLKPLVSLFVRNSTRWDPQTKGWYVKKDAGEDGFKLSSDPKPGGSTYMGVDELLTGIQKRGEKKEWFDATLQAGIDAKGVHGKEGDVSLDDFKKLGGAERTEIFQGNRALFDKHMASIAKEGEGKLYDSSPVLGG